METEDTKAKQNLPLRKCSHSKPVYKKEYLSHFLQRSFRTSWTRYQGHGSPNAIPVQLYPFAACIFNWTQLLVLEFIFNNQQSLQLRVQGTVHLHIQWVTEGRRHPNPSRLYPIHKLNADLILWSYVTQTGMVIMLSVSSGTARFCSFLTLLYSAVSESCPDLLFHCIPTDKPSTAPESPSPAPVQIFCISALASSS